MTLYHGTRDLKSVLQNGIEARHTSWGFSSGKVVFLTNDINDAGVWAAGAAVIFRERIRDSEPAWGVYEQSKAISSSPPNTGVVEVALPSSFIVRKIDMGEGVEWYVVDQRIPMSMLVAYYYIRNNRVIRHTI